MRWIARNIVWLVALCMLVIFRGTIVEWMTECIEPITSGVDGDNWWVMAAFCLGITLCYIAAYKRLQTQYEAWITRYERLLFLFAAYLILRLSPEWDVYGMEGWAISYTDCAWICVIVIEAILYRQRRTRRKERRGRNRTQRPNRSLWISRLPKTRWTESNMPSN